MGRTTPSLDDARSSQPVAILDLRDHPLVDRPAESLRPVGVDAESLGAYRVRQSARTVEGLRRAG